MQAQRGVFRTNNSHRRGGGYTQAARCECGCGDEPSLAESVEALNRVVDKLAKRTRAKRQADPAIEAMSAYSGPNAVVNAIRRKEALDWARREERQGHQRSEPAQRNSDDAVHAMTEYQGHDAVQRLLKERRAR